jgi:peroxiredoxin
VLSDILEAGQRAPDFLLPATPDQRISLAEFRGRPVVLAFFPAAWSPVCDDQLTQYQAALPAFSRRRATLLGISCDGIWCHVAFARHRGLHFPLLSDFEPKGTVARRYGVYDTDEGTAGRALFVLDDDGTITWSHLSPSGVNPGTEGVLAALDVLDRDRAVHT